MKSSLSSSLARTFDSLVNYLHEDKRSIIPEILEQCGNNVLLESEHLNKDQKSEVFKRDCEKFVTKKIAAFIKAGHFIVPPIFAGTESLDFLKESLPRKITKIYHVVLFFNILAKEFKEDNGGSLSDEEENPQSTPTGEKKEEGGDGLKKFLNALVLLKIMSDCDEVVEAKLAKLKTVFESKLFFDKMILKT